MNEALMRIGEVAAFFSVSIKALRVYEKMGIYCVAVHPTRFAACAVAGEYFSADGPYCDNPKLTTGAGDNFNAGFCFGQAVGLEPLDSLLLGVVTSGFYVRNARSPNLEEAAAFFEEYMRHL